MCEFKLLINYLVLLYIKMMCFMIVCVVLDLLLFFEVIFNDLMFRFNNLICMLISMLNKKDLEIR